MQLLYNTGNRRKIKNKMGNKFEKDLDADGLARQMMPKDLRNALEKGDARLNQLDEKDPDIDANLQIVRGEIDRYDEAAGAYREIFNRLTNSGQG